MGPGAGVGEKTAGEFGPSPTRATRRGARGREPREKMTLAVCASRASQGLDGRGKGQVRTKGKSQGRPIPPSSASPDFESCGPRLVPE